MISLQVLYVNTIILAYVIFTRINITIFVKINTICFGLHILHSQEYAKHVPLFKCYEKYMFDTAKSDASSDFVFD
jgi:hypothetical protein